MGSHHLCHAKAWMWCECKTRVKFAVDNFSSLDPGMQYNVPKRKSYDSPCLIRFNFGNRLLSSFTNPPPRGAAPQTISLTLDRSYCSMMGLLAIIRATGGTIGASVTWKMISIWVILTDFPNNFYVMAASFAFENFHCHRLWHSFLWRHTIVHLVVSSPCAFEWCSGTSQG